MREACVKGRSRSLQIGPAAQPAITPLALLIIEDGREDVELREVGPKDLGHPDFCVRDLPQQKIAYAHFAAGADEQVRIWHVMGVQVSAHRFIVEGKLLSVPSRVFNK